MPRGDAQLREGHEAGNFEGAEGKGHDPMPSQDLMSGEWSKQYVTAQRTKVPPEGGNWIVWVFEWKAKTLPTGLR